jgi:hypothetical protein
VANARLQRKSITGTGMLPAPGPAPAAPEAPPAPPERRLQVAGDTPDDVAAPPAPAPAPATSPAPAPAPAKPAPKSAARRPAAEPAPSGGSAWELVAAARASSRRDRGQWDTYTVKLPSYLFEALKRRWLFDRERTQDRQLGYNHMIDAAISTLPRDRNGHIDVAAAAALGGAWADAHPGPTLGVLRSTGSKISIPQRDAMFRLDGRLPDSPVVYIYQVLCAAIEALLADLDREVPVPEDFQ